MPGGFIEKSGLFYVHPAAFLCNPDRLQPQKLIEGLFLAPITMSMKASLFCVFALFFFVACKQHSDSGPDFGQGVGRCRISAISSRYAGTTSNDLANIQYDADGRPSLIANGLFTADISYSGSLVLVKRTYNSSGTILGKDTFILADGRITALRGYNGNNASLVTFNYDANGVLTTAQSTATSLSYHEYFTWANGDLTVDSTVYSGAGTSVMHYAYFTDKNNQLASVLNLNYFLYTGLILFHSQHLVQSRTDQNGASEQHYYSFDGDNKVITDSVGSAIGGSAYKATFSYECK